jgi:predicted TIM-barrel fold metal-dependent hydrolase
MSKVVPILDTHIHLWDTKHPELKWVWLDREAVHPILGNIDAIKSVAFTLENLWSEARFSDISGFVHVQAAIGSPDPVVETEWLTKMAQTGPVPLRIIADSPLNAEGSIEQIRRHQESELFVGIRDFNAEPMIASKELLPQYEKALTYLAKEELVFELDCEWFNMDEAVNLANRHPTLKIVLEHFGFPRRRDDEYFKNWNAAIGRLAKAENVVIKISGLPMTDPRGSKESMRKWAESSLEAFGSDRAVLGSNWPVDRLYLSYATIIDFTREYVGTLSDSEQEKVCNQNAAKLYKF